MLAGNPIYARLGKPARRQMWITLVGIALVAGIIGFLIPISGALGVGFLILLSPFVPVAIAGHTAYITSDYSTSDDYRLVRITALRPEIIVRGFILAGLDQASLVLVLNIALIPATVRLWMMEAHRFMDIDHVDAALRSTAFTFAGPLMMPGAALMAAALGALIGLRVHDRVVAGIVSAVAMLVVIVGAVMGVLIVLGDWNSAIGVLDAILLVSTLVLPYGMAVLLVHLAQRNA
jgi:hypothetical protein